MEIPEIPARQVIGWTLGITAVFFCFWLVFRFPIVLLLFLTALIFSTMLRPAVIWPEKRGVDKRAGILLIYGAISLLLGLLVWLTLPVLAQQGTAVQQSLADGYQFIRENLQRLPNIFLRRFLFSLPVEISPTNLPADIETDTVNEALAVTLIQGQRVLRGVFHLVVVALLAFYWILEGEHIKQAAFLLLPMQKRSDIRELVQDIESKVSGYLLGQALLCLIIGVMAFAAYSLIGLPHTLLLAIVAGLLEAVPIAGPFLGAVPAFLVGLSISPTAAFWVIVASILIQQLENSLLVPRVMKRTIGVSPLVTLLALLAFGSLFGILGALIALPLAAVIQLLLNRWFVREREGVEETETRRDRLSVLRYETKQLVQDVRSQVRHKGDVPSAETDALEDEVETIALELEKFLAGHGEETE
ncbi:MAG: AI-2E family transporter [Chloroflexota bacterium]